MTDDYKFRLRVNNYPIEVSVEEPTLDNLAAALLQEMSLKLKKIAGVFDEPSMEAYLGKKSAYHVGDNLHVIISSKGDAFERFSAVVPENKPLSEYLEELQKQKMG